MKVSKYNRIINAPDGKLLAFNSATCALAVVENDFMDIIDNIKCINLDESTDATKELINEMMEGNFIVDDELDELKMIKYRNYSGKFIQGSFGFVIAPTLACNFACPYCYETAKPGFMSQQIQDKLLEQIQEATKKKQGVHITWYGGEPLLAKDIIDSFSEKAIKMCEEEGVEYGAYIVTNGYLIDDEIIKLFKRAKITGAQITIDGPPDIHNLRRKLKNSSEPTFERILDNVKTVMEGGIKNITLRINVDKTNLDRIDELLDIFDEKGLKEVAVNLGHVTAYTEACSSVVDNCLNMQEYADGDSKYQKIMHDRGYRVAGNYPYYPGIKQNYCCADHEGAYVIDPEGYMYKCWNDVGIVEKAVGNVCVETPSDKMFSNNINYILWSPFEYKECTECNILPVCMGGCPHQGIAGGKPSCEKWKYSLDQTIIATYEQNNVAATEG